MTFSHSRVTGKGQGIAHNKYQVIWDAPPSYLAPGAKTGFDIAVKILDYSGSWNNSPAINAHFDAGDIKPGYGTSSYISFTSDIGSSLVATPEQDIDTYLEISKAVPEGKAGDKKAIVLFLGNSTGYSYIYEWKAGTPAAPVTPPASTPAPSAGKDFSDLPQSHWGYSNIMEMVEFGILSGYPDGTFRPNNTISRAEFAKIMVLALKLKTVSANTPTFADVPQSYWAFGVVESARDYLTGYQDSGTGVLTFEPSGVAVREDVAVAIVKAKGKGNAQADLSLLDRFADQDQISQALRSYVAIAVKQGYMQGTNLGFEPQKALTRAEACALLSRLIDRSQFEGGKQKITL